MIQMYMPHINILSLQGRIFQLLSFHPGDEALKMQPLRNRYSLCFIITVYLFTYISTFIRASLSI